VLKAHPAAKVRALIVWEPVLTTDWGSPSPALTSLIADPRAVHFFDRDRHLSAMLGGKDNAGHLARASEIGFRMKDVIWDCALVYPPGAAWGTPADLAVAPVVEYRDRLDAALPRP
jgi:hypothetical protein